jgi:hypothetical protein
MRNPLPWILTAALCGVPMTASAHTGGPLDANGCHADHRTGNYHCHRGPAAGYTFPNQAAMEEAVRTGVFPEKTVDEEGFFSKLWPFGTHHEQQETPAAVPVAPGAATDASAEAAPAPAAGDPNGVDTGSVVTAEPALAGTRKATVAPQPESEAAKKLKVLQGLFEMGLISKEEYEAKRKAILDTL